MIKRIILPILIIVAYVFLPSSLYAGGGRVLIYNVSQGVAGTTQSYFTAQVFKNDSMSADFSQGERFEVRIDNPRNGDKCYLNNERTNEIGMLTGQCEATTPGEYLMYLYSLDLENESSRHYVYFSPKPTPKATLVPKKSPIATPSPKPIHTPVLSPSPSTTSSPSPTQEILDEPREVKELPTETQEPNIIARILHSILQFLGLKK